MAADRLAVRRRNAAIAGVVLAGASLAIWRAGHSHAPPLADAIPIVRPIDRVPAHATAPALSPDGRDVAFSAALDDPANVDVYVVSLETRERLRVTRNPGLDEFPAWSPDGRQLAFVRRPSPDAAHAAIVAIAFDGTPERTVAEIDWRDNVAVQRPAIGWLPGSQEVAFASRSGEGRWTLRRGNVNHHDERPLIPASADGRQDVAPAMSPDGTRLAFSRCVTAAPSRCDLMVAPFAASEPAGPAGMIPGAQGPAVRWATWLTDGAVSMLVFADGPRLMRWVAGRVPEVLHVFDHEVQSVSGASPNHAPARLVVVTGPGDGAGAAAGAAEREVVELEFPS